MIRVCRCLFVCLLCLFVPGVAATAWGQSDPIRIFAAASLKSVLDELGQQYHMQTGRAVSFVYGGSGALARQISQGAPADGFVSANTAWMDWLVAQNIVPSGNIQPVASNELVLIGHAMADPMALWDLPNRVGPNNRLALGLTSSVPAGIYARTALERAGVWDAVHPYIVETQNVRAVLSLVTLGQADFGIVYASDMMAVQNAVVLTQIDPKLNDQILYTAAPIGSLAASDFIEFMTSDVGKMALRRWGFIAP